METKRKNIITKKIKKVVQSVSTKKKVFLKDQFEQDLELSITELAGISLAIETRYHIDIFEDLLSMKNVQQLRNSILKKLNI